MAKMHPLFLLNAFDVSILTHTVHRSLVTVPTLLADRTYVTIELMV